MSATTMAAATRSDTVEPLPGREPDHAAVCSIAISVRTLCARNPEIQRAGGLRPIQATPITILTNLGCRFHITCPSREGTGTLRKQCGRPTIATRLGGLLGAIRSGTLF